MIKAVIIDDELKCITSLKHDLAMFCPDIEVIAACQSAREGIAAIKDQRPDVAFLDVEMPQMNGFEVLEALLPLTCRVIFITAHDRFAAKAFRVSAVDFLTKPVHSDELIEAVEKVKQLHKITATDVALQNLLQNLKIPEQLQKLTVPVRDGYELIPINEIVYCRAVGSYTDIILKDTKLLSSRPLGATEQALPAEAFERVHHSLLINIQHVKRFKKNEGNVVVMDNGDELAVARSKKDRLLQRLGIKS